MSPPWVLWEDPEKPPPPEGPGPVWVWQPDLDPKTYLLRYGRHTNRRPTVTREFTNALRLVSHVWHDVLDEADRAQWLAWSLTQDGARPGKKVCPANGWDLFAMTALAPMWFTSPSDGLIELDDSAWPDSLTFDAALYDENRLNFTVTLPLHPYNRVGCDFVYMVDPAYVGHADQSRRTLFCGYYQNRDHPEPQAQQFYVEPSQPMEDGGTAHVLVRHHASLYGVRNYELSQAIT